MNIHNNNSHLVKITKKDEINGDVIQEILNEPPHWIVRSGSMMVLLTLLLLLSLIWFVKFNDIIEARITLTTQKEPLRVIAQTTGNLEKLFVNENQFVKKGAFLAAIQNKANSSDVFHLKLLLNSLKLEPDNPERICRLILKIDNHANFSELQIYVDDLTQKCIEYQITINNLNYQKRDQKIRLISNIQESFNKLYSELTIWEQKYILKAPSDGTVLFHQIWNVEQLVKTGDELVTILPESNEIIGKIYLPLHGFSKAEIGQEVNIKFDSYPMVDFGSVLGIVESISAISHENKRLIRIRFPDGLQTSNHKKIPFKEGIRGDARIIVKNIHLLERLFGMLHITPDYSDSR